MKFLSLLLIFIITGIIITAGCTTNDNINEGSLEKSINTVSEEHATSEYASAPTQVQLSVIDDQDLEIDENSNGNANIYSDQKIIKNADIRIEVENVTYALEIIQGIGEKYNGFIQSSSITINNQNTYNGVIILRIPAVFFENVLHEINLIGKIQSSSINSEDVTEEYVDLHAQKDALTNQLVQYNRLLLEGQNVSEILEVQKEIDRVQLKLDRIVGRLNYLNNRIGYSTFTVTLFEPIQVETPGTFSLPNIINDGIEGFFTTLEWIFIVILSLLPFILMGGAGYWLYQRWKRNHS